MLFEGLSVIDVVEGTALDALASMQSFLRSRPSHFKSVEHAIEWRYYNTIIYILYMKINSSRSYSLFYNFSVRSGQIRNLDSAKVSMQGQIIK